MKRILKITCLIFFGCEDNPLLTTNDAKKASINRNREYVNVEIRSVTQTKVNIYIENDTPISNFNLRLISTDSTFEMSGYDTESTLSSDWMLGFFATGYGDNRRTFLQGFGYDWWEYNDSTDSYTYFNNYILSPGEHLVSILYIRETTTPIEICFEPNTILNSVEFYYEETGIYDIERFESEECKTYELPVVNEDIWQ